MIPALRYVQAHADDYRRCAQIVGCTVPYPHNNQCGRCEQTSEHPLVPHPTGWHCRGCAYPGESNPSVPAAPSELPQCGTVECCAGCGQRLLAPISRQRGICERCRLESDRLGRAAHEYQEAA